MISGRSKIVVIGAGFAGLNAVKNLGNVDVDITIVDRRNFHLFQPLLYQVASAALNPSDIAYPIRSIFKNQQNVARVVLGEVTSIDLERRRVKVDTGDLILFDYLVVASGATHSYFGNDGWARHAPGLKTIEDALYIRRVILSAFEEAENNPERSEELLTFVVVGAGPTGVEMAGAMAEIAVHALVEEFKHVDPSTARVVLVEGADHVLPVYPEKLSHKARGQLESLGVEVLTGSLVDVIDEEGITLADGTRIDAGTVLWAAGVKASRLGEMLETDLDRAGRVVVGPDLSVPGRPNVFAIGDLAAVPDVPGVAPAAIQMGKHVARVIRGDFRNRERKPFVYRNKGSLATIGRARGVADMGRFQFSGFMAWAAWLGVHIWYLIGFRNRILVMINWAWNYLTFRRGARIITGQPQPPHNPRS